MSDLAATLSLCMIVRDAERSLGQALASARPFVDEMVVVDTGSVDGTRQVAKELGARLFEYPWCDDFSAARNESLTLATGDWIFWMDADDVLPPESGPALRKAIAAHPERDAAFWVTVEQTTSLPGTLTSHAHLKLFPRHPEIRFRYRVHEQIAPAIQCLGLKLKQSGAKVLHANADHSPQADARRQERNLRLLNLDLADHPDDPTVLLALAMAHLRLPGGPEKAISYSRRCVTLFKQPSPAHLNASLVLASAHRAAGERQAELQELRSALEIYPRDAAVLSRLARIHEERGDVQSATNCLQKLLSEGKLHLSVLHDPNILANSALRLGQLYIRAGERPRAEQLWSKFLQRHPDQSAIRQALAASLTAPHSIIAAPPAKPANRKPKTET